MKDKIRRSISMPSDIAKIAAMMTSKDGSFINGENYVVETKALEFYSKMW